MLLAIPANDIDMAGVAVDAALPVPWLDAELEDARLTARAPGRIVGRLSRSGDDIVVRARVSASLTTPCARCLDPANLDVDTELTLLLKPAAPAPRPGTKGAKAAAAAKSAAKKKPVEDEYEFTSAEADVDTYDGETVVLDPFLREAVLLEVPNFPLCSESCPGIGRGDESGDPRALADGASSTHPIDPRLAPLAAVRLNGKGLTVGGDPRPPEPPRPKKQKKE